MSGRLRIDFKVGAKRSAACSVIPRAAAKRRRTIHISAGLLALALAFLPPYLSRHFRIFFFAYRSCALLSAGQGGAGCAPAVPVSKLLNLPASISQFFRDTVLDGCIVVDFACGARPGLGPAACQSHQKISQTFFSRLRPLSYAL